MKTAKSMDFAGVTLSALCVLHCIAIPLLLVVFPAVGAVVAPTEELTHQLLLVFVLGVAGFAFYNGYKMHGQKKPVIWMAVGVIILTFAAFFAHDTLGHEWEPVVTVIGSVALIRAHLMNHKCKTCEQHSCSHQG